MSGTICAACWRAPRIARAAATCSAEPMATLATSVAVSIASHGSFFKDAIPWIRIVRQPEVPIERRCPSPRALWPLDQDDRALPQHVVKAEVPRFVGVAQAVAVDVVDGSGTSAVMMHQRVRGTGGARPGAQAAADGLNERRLPGPQLSRQPDYGGGAELVAQVLTEPTELARGEAHRP